MNPNKPYRLSQEKVQCTFYSDFQFFELIFFDSEKPQPSACGTFKHLRTDNFIFLIKNIPVWEWFVNCAGYNKPIKGWKFVQAASSSPGYTKYGVPLFRRILQNEDYFPLLKHSKSSDTDKQVMISPFKGTSICSFKEEGGCIDYCFLRDLNCFLLTVIEQYNFTGIHDLKPQNILYNERTRLFNLVDFQDDKYSYAFCCLASHAKYPRTLSGKFKGAIHILSDNVVMTTFHLLDKDKFRTYDFFRNFLPQFKSKFKEHLFYTYLDETLHYILEH